MQPDPASVNRGHATEETSMHASPILLIAAALIAATAMPMPAGSAPAGGIASKATTEKCKKVGDECLKSPLCHSSNQAVRQQCEGRCNNKQSKCLGYSPRAEVRPTTKEGKAGAKIRVPVTRPVVQQPTKAAAPKPILRGSHPARNPK